MNLLWAKYNVTTVVCICNIYLQVVFSDVSLSLNKLLFTVDLTIRYVTLYHYVLINNG